MAQVILREFGNTGSAYGTNVQAPAEPALADQTISTSGVTASSAAFNTNTRIISISTAPAQACAVLFSATPGAAVTALTTSMRLPANSVFFFAVRGGDKVAFIDVT